MHFSFFVCVAFLLSEDFVHTKTCIYACRTPFFGIFWRVKLWESKKCYFSRFLKVTREEFETMCAPLMVRVEAVIDKAVSQSGYNPLPPFKQQDKHKISLTGLRNTREK